MALKELRHHARILGIEHAEYLDTPELIRAIQSREGKVPCFDQQWCKPTTHHACPWRRDCHAHIEPVRGLVLSKDSSIGERITGLLGSSFNWQLQDTHDDKQAFSHILPGNMDVVVADIEATDLSGLAVLAYAKHHWPSTVTYAISQSRDRHLKRLAYHIGGCEGIFYLTDDRIELDTRFGLESQLIHMSSEDDGPNISFISTIK